MRERGQALERLDRLQRWAYEALEPSAGSGSSDPDAILAGGHGTCSDYALVFGAACRRAGLEARWVSMGVHGHPGGRGPRRAESHVVVEVTLPGGARQVVDPMAGVRFPAPIERLLGEPALADVPRTEDERYRSRRYELYATSHWYRRVRWVVVRPLPASGEGAAARVHAELAATATWARTLPPLARAALRRRFARRPSGRATR